MTVQATLAILLVVGVGTIMRLGKTGRSAVGVLVAAAVPLCLFSLAPFVTALKTMRVRNDLTTLPYLQAREKYLKLD